MSEQHHGSELGRAGRLPEDSRYASPLALDIEALLANPPLGDRIPDPFHF